MFRWNKDELEYLNLNVLLFDKDTNLVSSRSLVVD
jgi:hypothetical protein